jgi:Peroxin-3
MDPPGAAASFEQNGDSRRRRRGGNSCTSMASQVVTAAAVAYGVYQLVDWAWQQQQQPRPKEMRSSTSTSSKSNWYERQQQLAQCRVEVAATLSGLMQSAVTLMDQQLDIKTPTKRLKALRLARRKEHHHETKDESTTVIVDADPEERDLWEQIKVRTLTRIMTVAYLHTMLYLSLTVQVHLLSRRLEQTEQPHQYQSVLLQTYESMFHGQGLTILIASIQRVVTQTMRDWQVMDAAFLQTNLPQWKLLIQQVRVRLEQRRPVLPNQRIDPDKNHYTMLRFLVSGEKDQSADAAVQKCLDETWDILESPLTMEAERDALDVTFGTLVQQALQPVLLAVPGPSLAQVLAKLKNTHETFYRIPSIGEETMYKGESRKTAYAVAMETLPSLLELGDASFSIGEG